MWHKSVGEVVGTHISWVIWCFGWPQSVYTHNMIHLTHKSFQRTWYNLTGRASWYCQEWSSHTCSHSTQPLQIHALTGLPTFEHTPAKIDGQLSKLKCLSCMAFQYSGILYLKAGLVPWSVEVCGSPEVSKLNFVSGFMTAHIQWKLNLQEFVTLVPFYLQNYLRVNIIMKDMHA